jgi:hypothetical protein
MICMRCRKDGRLLWFFLLHRVIERVVWFVHCRDWRQRIVKSVLAVAFGVGNHHEGIPFVCLDNE